MMESELVPYLESAMQKSRLFWPGTVLLNGRYLLSWVVNKWACTEMNNEQSWVRTWFVDRLAVVKTKKAPQALSEASYAKDLNEGEYIISADDLPMYQYLVDDLAVLWEQPENDDE